MIVLTFRLMTLTKTLILKEDVMQTIITIIISFIFVLQGSIVLSADEGSDLTLEQILEVLTNDKTTTITKEQMRGKVAKGWISVEDIKETSWGGVATPEVISVVNGYRVDFAVQDKIEQVKLIGIGRRDRLKLHAEYTQFGVSDSRYINVSGTRYIVFTKVRILEVQKAK